MFPPFSSCVCLCVCFCISYIERNSIAWEWIFLLLRHHHHHYRSLWEWIEFVFQHNKEFQWNYRICRWFFQKRRNLTRTHNSHLYYFVCLFNARNFSTIFYTNSLCVFVLFCVCVFVFFSNGFVLYLGQQQRKKKTDCFCSRAKWKNRCVRDIN